MEIQELKAKAFDLLAAKDKHLIAIDQINKQLQPILEKILELEGGK